MADRHYDKNVNASILKGDAGPSAPETGAVRWSVSPEQAETLANAASGKRVLEIGTGTGLSTEALASTALLVDTYDVDPEVERLVWPDLPDNVTARMRPETLQGGPYDVVFLDGLHSAEGVAKDIREILPLTHRGTVWIFHDWHMASVQGGVNRVGGFRIIEDTYDAGPTTMAIGVRE